MAEEGRPPQGRPPPSKKYRSLSPKWRYITITLPAVAILLNVVHWFHLTPFGFIMYPMTNLYMLMAAFLPMSFLYIPAFKKAPRDHVPWYDIAAAVVAFGILLWFISHQNEVNIAGWDTKSPPVPFTLALVLMLLVIDAARRAGGTGLFIIVVFFAFFPLYACYVPVRMLWGECSTFNRLISNQMISEIGMFGIIMEIFSSLVLGFILFATAVQVAGAGKFFNDLAVALVGKTRGGTAKVSIVASGFFGSISGMVVPNVMTTGAFTIPAMKREGMSSTFAGGVEATASAGGTIMPPVMGTAAFIMTEFTQIPYANICIAAFIPAILYFFCLFLQIDSHAAKTKMRPAEIEVKPPPVWLTLVRNYHIIIGFLVLVGLLFFWRVTAQSAYIATGVVLVLALFQKSSDFGIRGIPNFVETSGRTLGDLLPILASVGLVIGGLTFTGVALSIPYQITSLAQGNVYLLLIIAAFAALILGMGMTAAAVYIFMAIIVAPGLVQFGLNLLAVHLFVMYWGLLSHITPPVALAAFAAASISGSDPMKTGFMAMRLGVAKYILPFIFVLSPALILRGEGVMDAVWVIPTAIVGLTIIAGALEGYIWKLGTLTIPMQVILAVVGLMVVSPFFEASLIGLVIFAAIFVLGKMLSGRSPIGRLLLIEPSG